ncbi:unnamed protein product [Lampetra fluviatilis]
MLTHHKHPTRHSSGEEDDDGHLVPPTAPGMAAPESPANASPAAEQHCAIRTVDPSPSEERRVASARLAELLGATADLVGKLNVGKPSMEELGPGPQEEALKALPTSLDDALVEFCAIPPARRSTLALALKEMAAVYDP